MCYKANCENLRAEGRSDGGQSLVEGGVELGGVATAGLGETGLAAATAAATLGGGAEHLTRLEIAGFLNSRVEEGDETDVGAVSAAENDGDAVAELCGEVFGSHLEGGGIDAVESGDEHLGFADGLGLRNERARLGDGELTA